ncbi:MAG: ATP-binding protein, partial [Planctomycetales bacterium]
TPMLAYQDSHHGHLASLVESNPWKGGVETERFTSGLNSKVNCPQNVIYLLTVDGEPFCARFADVSADPYNEYGRPASSSPTLETLALDEETAERGMEMIQRDARKRSVYRGQSVALVEQSESAAGFDVEFQDAPPVERSELVLPQDTLDVVERNVLGFLKHAETLENSGRSTRHGVLFHGPPGVGKTLALRYLVSACKEQTIISLSGRNLRFVRESMTLARLLAPSIVVLEDVDLIAEERTTNSDAGMLHALLDEMDGMGRKTPCIFLLTTNRPEILEPALASRPGRVDQAIFFPLPDAKCRGRLIELYGKGLELSQIRLDDWVAKTEGVSPAFISEWLRKTALMAAERGETKIPLPITEQDMDAAMRELVFFGGVLTQTLLAYRGESKAAPDAS